MPLFEEVMDYFGYIANIAAVIGIPYSAYLLIKTRTEYKRDQERSGKEELRKNTAIAIQLKEKEGTRTILLPNKIRRGELSRAEVLGRLGMIPMLPDPDNPKNKQRRFEIKKNATQEFIQNIDKLYTSSEGNLLTINCESEEMDQFDIVEIRKLGFDILGFD